MILGKMISEGIISNKINRPDRFMEGNDTSKDVISKLKFISQVRKGEKINVRNMYVQPDGLITKISRTIFNIDNRQNTLNFVENTIQRGFEIIELHKNNDFAYDKTLCANIVSDLNNCKTGLENLKHTYNDDIMFGCKIQTLIEHINAKMQDFCIREDMAN